MKHGVNRLTPERYDPANSAYPSSSLQPIEISGSLEKKDPSPDYS